MQSRPLKTIGLKRMKQLVEFVNNSTVELIKHNASDIDVARAAWVSNFGGDARERDAGRIEGLIKFLYNNRHMSPFEHGSFTFFIDTPIFVAREFMRHRTMSYNEVSGRYKQLDDRVYLAPYKRPLIQQGKVGAYEFVSGSDDQYAFMKVRTEQAVEDAFWHYHEMMDKGIAKEVARNVLPVGTMTQFYATVNPRNLMQFLELRNDKHALYEIREVAVQMEAHFKDAMPLTHAVYTSRREENHTAEMWREMYERERAHVQRLIEKENNPSYIVNMKMTDGSDIPTDRINDIVDRFAKENGRNV